MVRSLAHPISTKRSSARDRAARSAGTPDVEFRAIFEAAPGRFLVLAPDLTIVAVSDGYLDATLTTRDGIVGRGLFEVFPDNPDDPDADGMRNLRSSLDRVRADLTTDVMAIQKYDVRRPDPDGGTFEERYWSPTNAPVLGPDGRLRYIIHRVEDVTDFIRLQHMADGAERETMSRAQAVADANRQLGAINAELRQSEAFLDSIIENIPAMVFVKDAVDLRFVRFNRAGEQLLGVDRNDLIGKSDRDFFPPEQAEAFRAKDREVFAGRDVVDIAEEPITTAESGVRILHTRKIPVFDAGGRPRFLVGISQDITERKAAEDDVRAAHAAAEAANLAKSEFLSRMSHELRTPLNAILGFSQLLVLDDLATEQRENVEHISRAGRHLLELINEVLDISRIESGQLSMSPEPVWVEDVLGELIALISPLAQARDIRIDAPGATCRCHVLADRQRLQQVLLNLLANAVKYNRDAGTVLIRCDMTTDDRLRISIQDTGFGIAPEAQSRLFTPFDRLGAEHGPIEGTGMGLALSKGLVEAMGGTIGADSRPGEGSTFWVELPQAEGPIERLERSGASTEIETLPTFERRVILQIEDNASNMRLIEQVIARRPGCEVIGASTGTEGLEVARRAIPDAILLDLHLPDLPGTDVLTSLKADPATRRIPVIVVTADATKSQERRLLADGAVAYLTKPLDIALLLESLESVLVGRSGD